MAEPDDLLGKADALMARHRLGRPDLEAYAEIPVLHDVVEAGAAREDLPVLTELAQAPVPVQEQAEALAQGLRASLLTALQPALDQLIETRLQERLEPLFEKMSNGLRADLQQIAREFLSEAINNAVAKELDRRKSGG